MLELWLHHEDRLDDDLLNFVPNLLGLFPVSLAIGTRTADLPLEDILQPELVLVTDKVLIILIETVIGQVNKGVIEGLGLIILFTRQSDEAIVIQKYSHRANN